MERHGNTGWNFASANRVSMRYVSWNKTSELTGFLVEKRRGRWCNCNSLTPRPFGPLCSIWRPFTLLRNGFIDSLSITSHHDGQPSPICVIIYAVYVSKVSRFFQCKSTKFHWKLHVTRADTSARIRVFRKKWRLKTIGKKLLQLVKASFRWMLRCPRVQRRETSNFAYFHKNSARGLNFRYKELIKTPFIY